MSATITTLEKVPQPKKLRITEIFASIQGESNSIGKPTVFIRLTGCPLRCEYCDTAYAFNGGHWMQLDEIASKVSSFNLKYVTVTGGEPLAQKSCLQLLNNLCEQGYIVSLETSGAIDISQVDPRVIKVVDIKTPASGEEKKNLWQNIPYLRERDQVKFVICNHSDYIWAKKIFDEYKLFDRCEVLLSPVMNDADEDGFEAKQLAEWIVRDQLDVRFQLQLHKILWGSEPGK